MTHEKLEAEVVRLLDESGIKRGTITITAKLVTKIPNTANSTAWGGFQVRVKRPGNPQHESPLINAWGDCTDVLFESLAKAIAKRKPEA